MCSDFECIWLTTISHPYSTYSSYAPEWKKKSFISERFFFFFLVCAVSVADAHALRPTLCSTHYVHCETKKYWICLTDTNWIMFARESCPRVRDALAPNCQQWTVVMVNVPKYLIKSEFCMHRVNYVRLTCVTSQINIRFSVLGSYKYKCETSRSQKRKK